MGRNRKMSLSPAKKAWLTRKHNVALSSLKRPASQSAIRGRVGDIHQLNGHGPYHHQWFVPSTTDPNKVYKVSLRADGAFMCDCPRFIFQKGPVERHKPCAHILEVKNQGVKAG